MNKYNSRIENRNSSVISKFDIPQFDGKTTEELQSKIEIKGKTSEQEEKLSKCITLPIEKLYHVPDEWNRFFETTEEETIKLRESIVSTDGIIEPITVWHKLNNSGGAGEYMVISGNRRLDVYRYLHVNSLTEENKSKYSVMPVMIYEENELTEIEARKRVIEANLQKRRLSKKAIQASVIEAAKLTAKTKVYGDGKNSLEEIAKITDVSENTVRFYKRIQKLIPELKTLYSGGIICRRAAAIYAGMRNELQKHLFEKGYYLLFSTKHEKELRLIDTIEDLDDYYKNVAKNKNSLSSNNNDNNNFIKPAGARKINIYFFDNSTQEVIREALMNIIDNDLINEKDRKLLLEQLNFFSLNQSSGTNS